MPQKQNNIENNPKHKIGDIVYHSCRLQLQKVTIIDMGKELNSYSTWQYKIKEVIEDGKTSTYVVDERYLYKTLSEAFNQVNEETNKKIRKLTKEYENNVLREQEQRLKYLNELKDKYKKEYTLELREDKLSRILKEDYSVKHKYLSDDES